MNRAFLAGTLAALALAACGQAEPGHGTPDAFVAVPDPVVASLSPDHGSALGGTTVTITGTGFADAGAAQVLVGGVAATGVAATGDSSLAFVAPPGTPGETVTITVFNQRGTVTMDGAYTYNELPTVLSVVGTVPGAGGATVTVLGSGFQVNEAGDPTVTVGGKAATNVQVQSDSHLTFTAPALTDPPVGSADLVVENANGTATLAQGYHYTRPGILMVGNTVYNGSQNTLPLYYIDPLAASPEPVQISTIYNLYRVRGIAPRGADVLVLYNEPSDGSAHLGTLDPFAGRIKDIAVVKLNGAVQTLISHLTLQNGAYYVINPRVVCCSTAQIYRIDIATGALTAVGATFTTPRRAMSMGPGAGTNLNLYSYMYQPIYAATTAGGAPVALGPALTGSSTYVRGAIPVAGGLYGITSYSPDPDGTDYGKQALVSLDPANGTFQIKSLFPENRYRQPGPTPASW